MPKLKVSQLQAVEDEVSARLKDVLNRGKLDNPKTAKLMRVSVNTVCTRKRNPETLTLAEIWAIEKATGCKQTIPFARIQEEL